MASAQARSGTRGRPPPKRWVLTWGGSSGWSTAQSSSEIRKSVVVRLVGVRGRLRGWGSVLFILLLYNCYSDRLLARLCAFLLSNKPHELTERALNGAIIPHPGPRGMWEKE